MIRRVLRIRTPIRHSRQLLSVVRTSNLGPAQLGQGNAAPLDTENASFESKRSISTSSSSNAKPGMLGQMWTGYVKGDKKSTPANSESYSSRPSSPATPTDSTAVIKHPIRRRQIAVGSIRKRRIAIVKERRTSWKERLVEEQGQEREEVEDMPILPPAKRLVRHLQPLHPRRKPRARVGSVPLIPEIEQAAIKEDKEKAKVYSQGRVWTPQSRRTGLIALKKGMSVVWDEQGIRVPVTVLQIQENQVLQNVLTSRGPNKPAYRAVQIGSVNVKPEKTHIGMRGHFRKVGVPCKRYVKEFEVSEDAHLPPGMKLSAFHFVPGQFVDVQGTTMGKGFQGVMKRWGFGGGNASHGTSLAHRTPGSTGQHQDPGRVWPGKKMPGRMGGKMQTMQNLYVVRVDTDLNLVFIKGNVPGPDDGRTPVYITDAKKKIQSEGLRLQAKSGGEGEWTPVDATGKPIAPAKGKEAPAASKAMELGRGVLSLPFPAGSIAMAKRYPVVLVAPSTRVSSPWAGGDGA